MSVNSLHLINNASISNMTMIERDSERDPERGRIHSSSLISDYIMCTDLICGYSPVLIVKVVRIAID